MAFSPPEVNKVALHRLLSQAFEGKENVRSAAQAKNSVTRAQMCEMLPHLREFFPAPERGEWTAEPRIAGPFAEGDRRTIEKLTRDLDEDFLRSLLGVCVAFLPRAATREGPRGRRASDASVGQPS